MGCRRRRRPELLRLGSLVLRLPIFYASLLDEYGWTAAGGALVVSLSRLEGGLFGPVIGSMVDRFGPRLMGMSGAAMVGLGFLAMTQLGSFDLGPLHVTAFAAFLGLYVGWMSIGYSAGSTSRSTAVNAWFRIEARAGICAVHARRGRIGRDGGVTRLAGGRLRVADSGVCRGSRRACAVGAAVGVPAETTRRLRLPPGRRKSRDNGRAHSTCTRCTGGPAGEGAGYDDPAGHARSFFLATDTGIRPRATWRLRR